MDYRKDRSRWKTNPDSKKFRIGNTYDLAVDYGVVFGNGNPNLVPRRELLVGR